LKFVKIELAHIYIYNSSKQKLDNHHSY